MSEFICLNAKCYTEGRCDFCDARCPDSTDAASLMLALKDNEHWKEIKEVAHDLYMEKCEQDAEKYRLYMQWCNDCPKAYDNTCSGADAKRCEAERKERIFEESLKDQALSIRRRKMNYQYEEIDEHI